MAVIEVRVTPLVLWIWLGGIVMTAGGVYCTLPRLIPKAARAHAHVAEPADPGVQAQPAPILDTAALETEATS